VWPCSVRIDLTHADGPFFGRGLGVALVPAVVDRSRSHPTSCGVSLTTETEANVGFYRSLGFEVRGEVEAAPGLRSWVMFCPTGGDR
jgi:ribosomal protein S18 acetylase RimI-like enzyme